jgi:hypothetical protein
MPEQREKALLIAKKQSVPVKTEKKNRVYQQRSIAGPEKNSVCLERSTTAEICTRIHTHPCQLSPPGQTR